MCCAYVNEHSHSRATILTTRSGSGSTVLAAGAARRKWYRFVRALLASQNLELAICIQIKRAKFSLVFGSVVVEAMTVVVVTVMVVVSLIFHTASLFLSLLVLERH